MDYIVNFNPIIIEDTNYEILADIEEKINRKISINEEEASCFLDNLCYIARKKVNEDLNDYNLKCDTFQTMFYYYFKKLNCEIINCMTQNVITDNIVGHSFSLLKIIIDGNEKLILLDPSYIQFFIKNRASKENYVMALDRINFAILTPDPGYFIKKDDMQKVNILLSKGYIELNEDFAQIYGDSFLNTKRGYNDINVYKTIPGKVYLNSFLKGNEKIQNSEAALEELGLNLELFKDRIDEKKK